MSSLAPVHGTWTHPPNGSLVVLPIRSFAGGKTRLATRLSPQERAELLKATATRVVKAADALPIVVMSNDEGVVEWAREQGLLCLSEPGGLDQAAQTALGWATGQGFQRTIVVHGDLPSITSLEAVVSVPGEVQVVIVRGHRDGGTPVLSVPCGVDFRFSYGVGSFDRHLRETSRLGLRSRVVEDRRLATDIDLPQDLVHFRSFNPLGDTRAR